MVRITDDDRYAALGVRLRDDLLHAQHVRTRCVHALGADVLQVANDLLFLAVGADEYRVARADFLRPRDLMRTELLEVLHDVRVVDDAPEHHTAAALTRGLLRELHRALHPVAEARALCLNDLHEIPPSA